jgi:hypothetical protein
VRYGISGIRKEKRERAGKKEMFGVDEETFKDL